jgi:hypothetical protein
MYRHLRVLSEQAQGTLRGGMLIVYMIVLRAET